MKQVVTDVNRLILKRSDFKSDAELYAEIHKQSEILLNNHYGISCYRSLLDRNIYIIEFSSLDATVAEVFMLPVWLTKEEAIVIDDLRRDAYDLVNSDTNDEGNNNSDA